MRVRHGKCAGKSERGLGVKTDGVGVKTDGLGVNTEEHDDSRPRQDS